MGVEILETLRTLRIAVTVIPPDRLLLDPASKIPPELLPRHSLVVNREMMSAHGQAD